MAGNISKNVYEPNSCILVVTANFIIFAVSEGEECFVYVFNKRHLGTVPVPLLRIPVVNCGVYVGLVMNYNESTGNLTNLPRDIIADNDRVFVRKEQSLPYSTIHLVSKKVLLSKPLFSDDLIEYDTPIFLTNVFLIIVRDRGVSTNSFELIEEVYAFGALPNSNLLLVGTLHSVKIYTVYGDLVETIDIPRELGEIETYCGSSLVGGPDDDFVVMTTTHTLYYKVAGAARVPADSDEDVKPRLRPFSRPRTPSPSARRGDRDRDRDRDRRPEPRERLADLLTGMSISEKPGGRTPKRRRQK